MKIYNEYRYFTQIIELSANAQKEAQIKTTGNIDYAELEEKFESDDFIERLNDDEISGDEYAAYKEYQRISDILCTINSAWYRHDPNMYHDEREYKFGGYYYLKVRGTKKHVFITFREEL